VKLLLVNPGQARALESEAGAPVEEGSGAYPPLGLLHLQAAVEAGGRHRADLLDACVSGPLERALAEHRREGAPDLVGITALTPNLLGVVETVQAVRHAFPATRVILGGPHVDLFPAETAALDGVDLVLQGEAEHSLPLLLDQLEEGTAPLAVPGLHTRHGAVGVPCAHLWSDDLDALPMPDRSRLEVTAYRGIAGSDQVFATMVTSRGCPFRCTFCSTPRSSYRFRSVASVVEEMERCARLGVRHVYFLDDTFPTSGARADELGEALARRRDLPSWSCRTAAAGLTEERLRLMKRAGCTRVQIGVETCTDEGLKVLGKRTNVAEVRETFAAARRVGMTTVAYFMVGLPTEQSRDDFRRLAAFARSLDPTFAMFNVLTLYPGTALFHRAVERGMVAADLWQRFAARPSPSFVPPVWDEHFTREELFALQSRVYRSFYLRPGKVLRLALSGGGLGRKLKAGLRLLASSWTRGGAEGG